MPRHLRLPLLPSRSSVAAELRGHVTRWLARHGIRAPAPSAATWDAEYASGRWAYLGQLSELSRFSVMAGYLRHFKPGGTILDVGCGEGVLLKQLRPDEYSRYVGVDLSSVAIGQAAARGAPNATWLVASADEHVPSETFDAIVFNEVLYYVADPGRTFDRYAAATSPGGLLLVSINTGFRGGLSILDDLKRRYRTLDETRLTHGQNRWSWIVTVFEGPRGRSA